MATAPLSARSPAARPRRPRRPGAAGSRLPQLPAAELDSGDAEPRTAARSPTSWSIGGGMCGLVAAFALLRGGIRNLRILDRNAAGPRGALGDLRPHGDPALAEAARSGRPTAWPRSPSGPGSPRAVRRGRLGGALPHPPADVDGLPALVPRGARPAGRERRRGDAHPARATTASSTSTSPAAQPILARQVVLANGRDGLGAADDPGLRARPAAVALVAFLGRHRLRAPSPAGGSSSSASAPRPSTTPPRRSRTAPAEVRLLARRARMPTINKLMGVGSFGLTAGYPALTPAWRWRIMHYADRQQTPAPRNSTQRVSRHPNAYFHFGAAIASMRDARTTRSPSATQGGRVFRTDFVILGTGFSVDADEPARPRRASRTGSRPGATATRRRRRRRTPSLPPSPGSPTTSPSPRASPAAPRSSPTSTASTTERP